MKKPGTVPPFLIATLLLISLNLAAQNPFIQHYNATEKLPAGPVFEIFQDSRKFVWFATDDGAIRFDGENYTHYSLNEGLSGTNVMRIREDSFGRIWFFNQNGTINYFFKNRIYNGASAPFLDSLKGKKSFFQDKDRMIYFFANNSREIQSLDTSNRIARYLIPSSPRQQRLQIHDGMYVDDLGKSMDNEFLILTFFGIFKTKHLAEKPVHIDSGHLFRSLPPANSQPFYDWRSRMVFDGEGHSYRWASQIVKYIRTSPVDTIILPAGYSFRIGAVVEGADGVLWVSSFDLGILCIKDKQVIYHINIGGILKMMKDADGNIWVCTNREGIYKINPDILSYRHFEKSCFRNEGIELLDADSGDGVWCMTGKNLLLLKGKTVYSMNRRFDIHAFSQVKAFNNSSMLIQESNNMLWALTGIKTNPVTKTVDYKELKQFPYPANDFKTSDNAREISTITGSWILTVYHGGEYQFKPKKRFIYVREAMNGIFYNNQDKLIICTDKNKYTRLNDSLVPFPELSGIGSKIIQDNIIIDKSNEILKTQENGLFLVHNHKLFNLAAAFDYRPDMNIRLVRYSGKTLYFTDNRNIYRCDDPLKIIENKPLHLEMIDLNFHNITSFLVKCDSLYIASDDGLTIIPEEKTGTIKSLAPIPYFQSIMINDKEIEISDPAIVLTGNNKIRFSFSCINYSQLPVRYSYKLEGADREWSEGTGRVVVYQNLLKGNYIFKVRTGKPCAQWSEPIEFKITIKAHFWQHPVFLSFLIILFLTLVFLAILRRKNLQVKRRDLDHQLITLEQKALQSMMNPHFIFNSLGSIQNFLLQKKSGEAGLYLSQFARLIRQNLNSINAANINLEEEIDRLKNYLDLEKLRMDNKFDFNIEVDENVEADELQIPSMIIQPFVENAIWHGVDAIEGQGRIVVRFRMRDDKSLTVIVEDNGIGMKRSELISPKREKHFHLGMEMARKRLELLGKKFSVKTTMDFFEVYPGSANPGTRVVLVVPVGMS